MSMQEHALYAVNGGLLISAETLIAARFAEDNSSPVIPPSRGRWRSVRTPLIRGSESTPPIDPFWDEKAGRLGRHSGQSLKDWGLCGDCSGNMRGPSWSRWTSHHAVGQQCVRHENEKTIRRSGEFGNTCTDSRLAPPRICAEPHPPSKLMRRVASLARSEPSPVKPRSSRRQ